MKMSNVNAMKVKELFENQEFAQKFNAAEDFAEVKALFVENGVEIADEELKQLIEAMLAQVEKNADTELSEDQMDAVAGGFVEWVIAGAVFATVAGVSAYKLRKFLNSFGGSCR